MYAYSFVAEPNGNLSTKKLLTWGYLHQRGQVRRQGGAMGANAPPHWPKRSAWKEPKKRKERQRGIFSSNLSTHAAFHSVENIPRLLIIIDQYLRDQSMVLIR